MSRYFGPLVQQAYVIPDIDKAMRYWTERLGIGPFFVTRSLVIEDTTWLGKKAPTHMHVAFGQTAGVQIELIQPAGGPSLYQDFLDRGHVGAHHVGYRSEDIHGSIQAAKDQGFKLVLDGQLGDVHFAYFETNEPNGPALIEFMEASESLLALQKMVADASIGWNGEHPIREMAI